MFWLVLWGGSERGKFGWGRERDILNIVIIMVVLVSEVFILYRFGSFYLLGVMFGSLYIFFDLMVVII